MHYIAYWDTKTLAIYFTRATPGVIDHTDHIAQAIVVDYTASEQLVSLDLNYAPHHSVCHFYDTDQWVGDKQPLKVTWDYDPASGDLYVYLTEGKSVGQLRHTEDPRVLIGVTDEGLWQAVVVRDAVQSIPAGASQAA